MKKQQEEQDEVKCMLNSFTTANINANTNDTISISLVPRALCCCPSPAAAAVRSLALDQSNHSALRSLTFSDKASKSKPCCRNLGVRFEMTHSNPQYTPLKKRSLPRSMLPRQAKCGCGDGVHLSLLNTAIAQYQHMHQIPASLSQNQAAKSGHGSEENHHSDVLS